MNTRSIAATEKPGSWCINTWWKPSVPRTLRVPLAAPHRGERVTALPQSTAADVPSLHPSSCGCEVQGHSHTSLLCWAAAPQKHFKHLLVLLPGCSWANPWLKLTSLAPSCEALRRHQQQWSSSPAHPATAYSASKEDTVACGPKTNILTRPSKHCIVSPGWTQYFQSIVVKKTERV